MEEPESTIVFFTCTCISELVFNTYLKLRETLTPAQFQEIERFRKSPFPVNASDIDRDKAHCVKIGTINLCIHLDKQKSTFSIYRIFHDEK